MQKTLNSHPAADIFPQLSAPEMEDLVASVKAEGLIHPIVTIDVDGETLILDGRNRYAASLQADVKPKFVKFESLKFDGTPERFVVLVNVLRRHLSTTARALLAAKLLPQYEAQAKERQKRKPEGEQLSPSNEGNKGDAVDLAGADFKVSGASVERAARVLKVAETGVMPDGTKLEPKKLDDLREKIEQATHDTQAGERANKVTVGGLAKTLFDPKPEPKVKETRADKLRILAEAFEYLPKGPLTKEEQKIVDRIRLALDVMSEEETAA